MNFVIATCGPSHAPKPVLLHADGVPMYLEKKRVSNGAIRWLMFGDGMESQGKLSKAKKVSHVYWSSPYWFKLFA